MAQNLATTTTLSQLRAQILGALGIASVQDSGIPPLEMIDLFHQSVMEVSKEVPPSFYITDDKITFAGTKPNYSVSVATKQIASLEQVRLYHSTLGVIPIIAAEKYSAWRDRYNSNMGVTDSFAKVTSTIGVSDSSPGGNYGVSGMSWTALTQVFTGTMNASFAVTDIGKKVIFRKGATSYEGKIAQFLSATTVVLSGLSLPSTDQAAVDAAIVVDALAISSPCVLTVNLYSGAAAAPSSVELSYPRVPTKVTVDADTLDIPEIFITKVRDLGTVYFAKRMAHQPIMEAQKSNVPA